MRRVKWMCGVVALWATMAWGQPPGRTLEARRVVVARGEEADGGVLRVGAGVVTLLWFDRKVAPGGVEWLAGEAGAIKVDVGEETVALKVVREPTAGVVWRAAVRFAEGGRSERVSFRLVSCGAVVDSQVAVERAAPGSSLLREESVRCEPERAEAPMCMAPLSALAFSGRVHKKGLLALRLMGRLFGQGIVVKPPRGLSAGGRTVLIFDVGLDSKYSLGSWHPGAVRAVNRTTRAVVKVLSVAMNVPELRLGQSAALAVELELPELTEETVLDIEVFEQGGDRRLRVEEGRVAP